MMNTAKGTRANLPCNRVSFPGGKLSDAANARAIAWLIAAALLAASVTGCGAKAVSERRGGKPVAIEIATFDVGAADMDVVLPARVKANEEVTLVTRLSARVTALRAREGDRVRRGDVIAEFTAAEMTQALVAARAERASAELALKVAARQKARVDSLFATRVVSERDHEVAVSEWRAAEARLESARASLDGLDNGMRIRAPFDGVVVRVHADPGADLPAGTPLVDLRSSSGLEVVAEVPEGPAARMATAALSVQIGDGPWRPAHLARLEGMTDWRSRSRTAHLTFGGDAEPGAYARLSLLARTDNSGDGSVPIASLVRRGALSGVFVVEENRARLRWLKLGRSRGDRVEVLAGLEAGERFALAPRLLTDGVAVILR